jgi:serine/threonine protein kinase
LQHSAIPPVHEGSALTDGRSLLPMKLIKGKTLERLLQARPEPSDERGRYMAVFEQVCQALAYAHAHDVIHRDLQPANVMGGLRRGAGHGLGAGESPGEPGAAASGGDGVVKPPVIVLDAA